MAWWFHGQSQREVYLAVWQICSKIDGSWLGQEEAVARETVFSSVKHALRELVINRADGYALPNSSSPDRLEAHAGGLSNGAPASPSSSKSARKAEHLAIVAKAFEGAWSQVADPVTRRTYEYILLARYVADKTSSDLVDRLGDDHIHMTAQEVSAIARAGWLHVASVLESHELVPTRTHKQLVTQVDLIGWKAIAEELGVTRTTARRYHEELGMPVRLVSLGTLNRAEASSEELKQWKAKRTSL